MTRQNPFPGMNPFMERTWPDVHVRLIAAVLDALGTELPEDLLAKGELRVDVLGGQSKNYSPDVAILSEDRWKHGLPPVWSPDPAAQTLVVTEPLLLEVEDVKHRWVEIKTAEGTLITVIEVLSPVNKTRQRDAYIAKRWDYLLAGVNVVEIDLVRQGRSTVNIDGTSYEEVHSGQGLYSVCVTRAAFPTRREFYPCPLRQKLPVIRIPLRMTDPDVPLDIQALVDRCYESGRYWLMDFGQPLAPPLSVEDEEWARECLKSAGLAQG